MFSVFERGPDEEGIETAITDCAIAPTRSNADLMKKGLRRGLEALLRGSGPFERGPDEEGIETCGRYPHLSGEGSNADLMKKGLRRSCGPPCRLCGSNADLMKKGLRPPLRL